MRISESKSSFLEFGMDESVLDEIKMLFHVEIRHLDMGFLKPNCYLKDDWLWLVNKFDDKINVWCNTWLSLGGRVTLIKVALTNFPIY